MLTILSIVAVLILSGCIEKTTDNKNDTLTRSSMANDTTSDIKSDVVDINIEEKTQINVSGEDTKTNSINIGSKTGSEWCIPGSKITASLPSGQEEFTVTGITTYTDNRGKSYNGLCKAERPIKGGNSVRYFNKEGTIVIMRSESSSNDGDAYAEASVSVSVNK